MSNKRLDSNSRRKGNDTRGSSPIPHVKSPLPLPRQAAVRRKSDDRSNGIRNDSGPRTERYIVAGPAVSGKRKTSDLCSPPIFRQTPAQSLAAPRVRRSRRHGLHNQSLPSSCAVAAAGYKKPDGGGGNRRRGSCAACY